MSQDEIGGSAGGRRRKRFLAPSEKYEIWIALVRGECTTREAADRAGVDRSTIMKLRQVAKQGALDALAASRPPSRPSPLSMSCVPCRYATPA